MKSGYTDSRAMPSHTLLRSWRPALYHLQLLSPAAAAWNLPSAPCVLARVGNGTAAVRLRGGRLRDHAGARTPLAQRTRAKEPLGGDESAQAGGGAARAWRHATKEFTARRTISPDPGSPFLLAGAILRFQRVDGEEAAGETALHTSKPGDTGAGEVARAVAVEQLSSVRISGERTRCCQRHGSAKVGRPSGMRFVPPRRAKPARLGHPTALSRHGSLGHPANSGNRNICDGECTMTRPFRATLCLLLLLCSLPSAS